MYGEDNGVDHNTAIALKYAKLAGKTGYRIIANALSNGFDMNYLKNE